MSFFYDLNKKLDSIREKPEVTHKQLNERDEGKPGKNFAKIAKDAGERYGSKAAGERVAGAVRNKLRAQGKLEEGDMDESAFQAAIGKKKYGADGMKALQKAGRDHASAKTMSNIRNKYDKYDESAGPAAAKPTPAKPSKPAPKGEFLGTIKGGVWTADPPKPGQKGVPAPSGDPEGVKEASNAGPLDFDKVLDAIAALYGDDIWDNDAMQDLAHDLEQAGPTDRELDFIIAKGRLPKRLAGTQFSAGDSVRFGESGAPMTSKQRSFAALAPPKNKITFADKIAGAKKEVDEMLGDVAAEAMRNALSPKQKKIDMNKNGKLDANDFAMLRKGAKPEMDEDNAFDYKSPRQGSPKVGSVERGHKHDIKHTATGRVVTRRTDDQGHSVGADDETDADGAPRGRGRPKGTKNVSSRAKVFQRKSKLMTKESNVDVTDQGEYDQEGNMAKNDIKTIVRHAQALSKVLGDNDNLPEWVQSKLAKIEGMMISVDEYMQNQADGDEEPIAEKAVSKQQQKFMGMAHAMQKGEKIKGASKELKKVAKTMKPKDVEDFAATKHKGLPTKVSKKKEVDENSEEGRLKTTVNSDGTTSTSSTTGRVSATIDKSGVTVKPAKSGGVSFGKGIYDSMNRELELMIAESMSINMSDSTEGNKSLTVTATDEDALKLGMLLKNAGLGSGEEMHDHGAEPCEACGSQDCGCGDVQEAVDENAPDWPTNTETSDDALQYAGGLNKPKTDVAGDGQTTIPNTAVHTQDEDALRRMMEMAGIKQADLEPWKGTMKEEAAEELDETEEDVEESIQRMREMAGIQNEEHIDLGPTSPEVAAMSNDEVNAALRSDMSPDISDMDPDEVNAQFGSGDDNQYEESIQRMREMAGIKEAKKPDYLDFDKDGDKKEPMTKALKDKEKKVEESIFTLTNQWRAYKG